MNPDGSGLLPRSIDPVLSCLALLLPLAYWGLRLNYRLALNQAVTRDEAVELTRQYHLLLIGLLMRAATTLLDQALIGLAISALLLYVAARVVWRRISVFAAHTPGRRVCIGPETVWTLPVYIGWALFLAVLAPLLPQSSP